MEQRIERIKLQLQPPVLDASIAGVGDDEAGAGERVKVKSWKSVRFVDQHRH
jgi:hypothetical protein